jgi:hypothetical protein
MKKPAEIDVQRLLYELSTSEYAREVDAVSGEFNLQRFLDPFGFTLQYVKKKIDNLTPVIDVDINRTKGTENGLELYYPAEDIALFGEAPFSGDKKYPSPYYRYGAVEVINSDIILPAGIAAYRFLKYILEPVTFAPYSAQAEVVLKIDIPYSNDLNGLIFSVITAPEGRTFSGKRTIWGVYTSIGFDMSMASMLRGRHGILNHTPSHYPPDIVTVLTPPVEPTAIFSELDGVFSGNAPTERIKVISPPTEDDIANYQPPFLTNTQELRPATFSGNNFRGDFQYRNYAVSGIKNEVWEPKPFTVVGQCATEGGVFNLEAYTANLRLDCFVPHTYYNDQRGMVYGAKLPESERAFSGGLETLNKSESILSIELFTSMAHHIIGSPLYTGEELDSGMNTPFDIPINFQPNVEIIISN